MKKIIMASLALALAAGGFAQEKVSKDKYTKGHFIGVQVTGLNLKAGEVLKQNGLSGLFANSDWNKGTHYAPGLELSYIKGLSNTADLQANLGFNFFKNAYQLSKNVNTLEPRIEANTMVNVKLLDDRYAIVPYLMGGIGASKWDVYFSAYIPVGMGIQFKMNDVTMLHIQAQDRLPVTTSSTSNHLFFSIGISGKFADFKKKAAEVIAPPPPPPAPKPADSDGDGVADSEDACPAVAGLANLKGCPDADNDGTVDNEDACPNISGPVSLKGCPDTDGDGIVDKDDMCPNQAGISKFNGCPDTDNDDIPDNEDKCPTEAGTPENAGCPALDFNPNNVEFLSSSVVLTKKAKVELDKLVSIMNVKYPSLKIQIEGHADKTGNSEANQKLSEDRAAAVKEYLIKQHVDASRLSSAGFGDSMPVAENTTAQGKQKNRRVEFKIVR